MVATAVLAAAILHKSRHDEVVWAESGHAESGRAESGHAVSCIYQPDPAAVDPGCTPHPDPAASRPGRCWSIGIGLSVVAFMGAMR